MPPTAPSHRDIYTVGRLNREARMLIDHGLPLLWVEGEISNLSRPASGHWYFSLKDRDAQVRCAMFRGRNGLLRFAPRDGQLVLVRAKAGLYEARGEFQLIVEHMEDAGAGALQREFERLRAKLEAEGLFDPRLKRPLPKAPTAIGVVTSPTGAALQDILNILRRRFPAARVIVYPAAVQGKEAVPQLLAAVARAGARAECDVLIVARGGGSIEDLWAFNDEGLARALRAAPMPVVTGIGHEIDFTIADFVADMRAPTPSGAAELVVPDGAAWRMQFARLESRFLQAASRRLRAEGEHLARLQRRLALTHPGQRLQQGAQRLDELEQRLAGALRLRLADSGLDLQRLVSRLGHASPALALQRLAARRALLESRLRATLPRRLEALGQRFALAHRTLHAVSPLATLDRGFAIVTREDGRLLRDAADAPRGTHIEARLGRGRLRATVDETLTGPPPDIPERPA
ncbi:MAG: exodeoxyribonuclease VII large subunit [Gammaproteobacteria bacterium]